MKKKHLGLKINRHNAKAMLLVALVVLIVFTFVLAFLKSKISNTGLADDKKVEIIDKTMPKVENPGLIQGNKDDLISFSITPNTRVSKVVSYRGVVKGGYFFEANILVNVLDLNKKKVIQSNAIATTEWMTAGPVDFEGYLDFSKAPKGNGYIEIHNDNASGIPENDKSILIPIIIE